MTHTKLFASAAIALAFGTAGTALAGSPADYFSKMDADANGVVTEAEFVAHKTADGKYTAEKASAKFAKLAGDDAEFTLDELEAVMKKHKKKRKDKADSDA